MTKELLSELEKYINEHSKYRVKIRKEFPDICQIMLGNDTDEFFIIPIKMTNNPIINTHPDGENA
jgi:hypothetical protein